VAINGLLIKRAKASLPTQTISHGSDIRILRVLGKGRRGRNYKVRRNHEQRLYSGAAHALQSWFESITAAGIMALFVLIARRIWYQAMAHLNL
jgi:hypothetical protein